MFSRSSKSVSVLIALACVASISTGCKKAPPITLAVTAAPPAVFAGEPVSATATAGSVDTKKKTNVIYTWSGDGVTGTGTSASVATASLAPGTYTVGAAVKEGKPGKEGLKPGQTAAASASFTVKPFEPPTISCSAEPTTIKPGENSNITAMGMSPQNRPLTYSFSASSGTVSGTGSVAVFASAGAPTGTTTITCNVSDDKGKSATASTSVTILAPYVPPVLHTQELSPLGFEIGKDKKNSARVNNEVKAVLDGLALTLNKQPDTKLVVVGDSSAEEKAADAKANAKAEKKAKKSHKPAPVEDLAAQRAVNVKDYLVKEKGIDSSRVQVMTGSADKQQVDLYLVPAGANFGNDVHGVSPVDESAVKPQVRKPLPMRKHHAKKAK